MTDKTINILIRFLNALFVVIIFIDIIFTGCKSPSPGNKNVSVPISEVQRKFELAHMDCEQCSKLLVPLEIKDIRIAPKTNIIFLSGSPELIKKASSVIDVIDSPEKYCFVNLGPASLIKTFPPNGQIEARLGGGIDIGTFNEPPVKDTKLRAIIDTYNNSTLAFVPVVYRDRLINLLTKNIAPADSQKAILAQSEPNKFTPVNTEPEKSKPAAFSKDENKNGIQNSDTVTKVKIEEIDKKSVKETSGNHQSTNIVALSELADPKNVDATSKPVEISPKPAKTAELPKTVSIVFKHKKNEIDPNEQNILTEKAVPENGEDILEMTLPETLTLIQLLDLAGKHLGLNYVYDTKLISNQPITLKLHGNLQGQMKVKNLYALLETVLDFMGLAMIRQQDNFVAIVPIDRALATQPELVNSADNTIQVGDTVITRVFEIKYVDIEDVTTLLQNMKLSITVTSLGGSNLLLVTCYSERMNRVEELVNLIDQPGKTMECRFRKLYFTLAPSLVPKVRSMAEQLKQITVTVAQTPAPAVKPAVGGVGIVSQPPIVFQPSNKQTVFLDIDERTNRILMIGYEEDLSYIEQIIDILDVAQEDPSSAGIYTIKYLDASAALDKLQKLNILKSPSNKPAVQQDKQDYTTAGEQPMVIVLDGTNQLLVRAAPDQHAKIREFLAYIDVAPGSARKLYAYELKNVEAEAAKKVLQELDITGSETVAPTITAGPNEPASTRNNTYSSAGRDNRGNKPLVVANKSTNALLIDATQEQHNHIAKIISYIDQKASEENLTYEIYPLENSSPEHIYKILDEILNATAKSSSSDKDAKIVKEPRFSEQVVIVPDSNTFSLIVYASRKNQQWIGELTDKLDKRRPQVLIDVTLVEVTRTDSFEYDLDIVANARSAVVGNIVINPLETITSNPVLEGGFNMRDADGNPTGQSKVFYNDNKIQALLTAMRRKNYGRVLAKPKILVDDGQEGQIITKDITTYVQETIQIPQTGAPITTRDFAPVEASIELLITPHISEGDLLRLDVALSRGDFGTRPLAGAPPDITSSKVNTTVFVPDTSTVILGGLVKLNQSKAGSKVPFLGDIPIIGALFRSINNSDVEKKLYVFLKANIIRPYNESKLEDLRDISDKYRNAFEKSEAEFQGTENWPGLKPKPMPPQKVLEGYE